MGKKKTKCIVLDLETYPFSDQFISSRSIKERTKYAPKMRIACIYDESARKYRFFKPEHSKSLIKILKRANEIVTFNGKEFDILVLRQHYGLKGRVPQKGKHTDIHEIMSKRAGFRVSLNRAVGLNFNESKHTSGRDIGKLNLSKLKTACRSDVRQTYKLWKCYKEDSLRYPERSYSSYYDADYVMGPGEHMPSICPHCGDVGSLEFVAWNTSDMSEGQLADYLAGLWGSAFCRTCKKEFDWGF